MSCNKFQSPCVTYRIFMGGDGNFLELLRFCNISGTSIKGPHDRVAESWCNSLSRPQAAAYMWSSKDNNFERL